MQQDKMDSVENESLHRSALVVELVHEQVPYFR
jgi:hypothetical protein